MASNLSSTGGETPKTKLGGLAFMKKGSKANVESTEGGSKMSIASKASGLKKKFGGGLLGKFKSKATGGKKKGNWFQKLKGRNINGAIVEDKLKIPLTHLSPDFLDFDLDENVEDDFLEDEDDNTYHRSESTFTNSENNGKEHDKSDEEENIILQKNQNLLDKLNKDIKAGLIDSSSVNSNNGRFSHKDTIKKIRRLITNRKAPNSLVLAMRILVLVILGSIGISIYAATLKVQQMKNLRDSIIDANVINKMNILMNKVTAFLEMEKLEKAPYNLDFNAEYTAPIWDFIK